MEKIYLVVDIGCLECGLSTKLRGFFKTEAEAQATAAGLDKANDYSSDRATKVCEIDVAELRKLMGD